MCGTPVFQAKGPRRAALVFLMRNRAFSDVLVFQRYNIDADTAGTARTTIQMPRCNSGRRRPELAGSGTPRRREALGGVT
jgi:hypothetical protein